MGDLIKLDWFYDQLEQHDWYYYFSDDMRVDMRGADNQKRLERLAASTPVHQELFNNYKDYMFSGPNFNKPVADKPLKPQGE